MKKLALAMILSLSMVSCEFPILSGEELSRSEVIQEAKKDIYIASVWADIQAKAESALKMME